MSRKNNRVCPVERAGRLDNPMRRLLQNPRKIVAPYIENGMTVLDVGCGPGFFSVDMAQMVGPSGRVIASDLQQGMLQKVRDKIKGTPLEERIILHKCERNSIDLAQPVDFILLFYMVHEVVDKKAFFHEIGTILKPNGRILMVEPPFHVSKSAFNKSVAIAKNVGFIDMKGPKVFLSKSVVLKKETETQLDLKNFTEKAD